LFSEKVVLTLFSERTGAQLLTCVAHNRIRPEPGLHTPPLSGTNCRFGLCKRWVGFESHFLQAGERHRRSGRRGLLRYVFQTLLTGLFIVRYLALRLLRRSEDGLLQRVSCWRKRERWNNGHEADSNT